MRHLGHSLLGLATIVLVAGGTSDAQTVREVVAVGDPFLGFTVGDFRDLAIGDDGEWFAVVSTMPTQGTPFSVIFRARGADGVFTPGLVTNLPGASATLANDLAIADYSWSGSTVTMSNALHGLLPGESVRLSFLSPAPSSRPADGFFTVQSVADASTFTVDHGSSGTCGSTQGPCGQVGLVRTVQAPDLGYSRACLPAFQGVLQMQDDDDLLTPPLIQPTRDDSGLFWNSTLLLREGALSAAPEVGPGTTYKTLWRSAVVSRQDWLLLALMDDPQVAGNEHALVELRLSEDCPPVVLSERVLVRTGDVIQGSGGRLLSTFNSTQKRSFALNERGDFMYLGKLVDSNGFPSVGQVVIVNDRAVLTEFKTVPGGAGQVLQLPLAAVDLNDLGDYVIQAHVQLPTRSGEAIVKGHVLASPGKFIECGDPLPDPSLGPGNEIILRIGNRFSGVISPLDLFPALITNGGDVIWYGEWGHVDPSGTEVTVGGGIFCNGRVVARRGQALSSPDDFLLEIGASRLDSRASLEVSPNGRYLLFAGIKGKRSDPSYKNAAVFRVDLGESVPFGTVVQATGGSGCTHSYPRPSLDCTPGLPLPNSTSLGDFPLLGHDLQLVASSAPPGTVTARFVFTASPPVGYPCGFFLPGKPFEILLGPAPYSIQVIGYSGAALFSSRIPASLLALLDTYWYGQAFFRDGAGRILGSTNAIRLRIGAR